jgi:hypothetical protein
MAKPQSCRAADLIAGLAPAGDRAALERIAVRYAVAITQPCRIIDRRSR